MLSKKERMIKENSFKK